MGYIVILSFTYPLFIYPTNQIIENFTINKLMPYKSQTKEWAINFSRFLVCVSAAYFAIELKDVLDVVIGLIGAVFCAPLAMIIPTLCHLKLMAKTRKEQITDIVIVMISLVIMLICILNALI